MITHLTHTFLQNFNWLSDQGLHLGMINNQVPPGRNHFYDQIISRSAANKHCLDIGFGTGLLSMLALKHGAQHVDAWECDDERHLLGCWILKKLGLQDRITLHHGRFNADYLEDKNLLVMHEIIGANVWDEGLRRALPLAARTILPGKIQVDFDVIQITQADYRRIFFPQRVFDPQVDLVPGFQECIQEFINATPQYQTHRREYFDGLSDCKHLQPVPFYNIDFQKKTINGQDLLLDGIPPNFTRSITVSVPEDHALMFYPRITILHQHNRLHWKWCNPILINQGHEVAINQDFNTGSFTVDVVV